MKAQTLEQQASDYWELSRSWNGHGERRFTMEQAFRRTNRLATSLNPARPLSRAVLKLEYEMIHKKSRKSGKTSKMPTNIVAMQRDKV